MVVCIVGSTATGKTRLSVALAEALGGEVVSFDSMQVYRGMTVGTAAPTQEEMRGVKHHMIGFLDPRERYSVGRYVRDADPIVQDILHRGKPVILVGGTGLYVDSLVAGRQFAPFPATGRREALTRLAEEQGIEPLMERLRQVDPQAAASIQPENRKRVIRALEVYEETGKTITQHNLETQAIPPKYDPVWIGLEDADRAAFFHRIERRTAQMLQNGLWQELLSLLDAGVPADATAMQAIGYKELLPFLKNGRALPPEALSEAADEISLRTRQYAKRQRTWFRRNAAVRWLDAGAPFDEIFSQARRVATASDKV